MEEIVYRAVAGAPTLAVVQLLQSHGLSPRTLDQVDALPLPMVVSIVVPAEEVARAVEVLRGWEAQNAALVKRTTAELRRDMLIAFGLSCLVVAAWAVTQVTLGPRFTAGYAGIAAAVIPVGTGLGTIVGGNLRASRRRRSLVHGPRCPHCGYSLLRLTVARCPECGQPFDPSLEDRAARLDE